MIILPSLEIVPAKYSGSTLLSQIPIDGTGDFTVSRTTSPVTGLSTRVNSLGLIETVADNVPRLDYPLGGAVNGCPALLTEPSAQNLALQSEDFGTTWSLLALLAFGSGSVLNTTATLDPYGTNVADLIVANTTVTQHRVDQTITHASGSYVFSVFLKAAGYGFARLRIGGQGAVFNLSTGVVFSTDAGFTSSIQSFGNSWYRCIIGKAASAANEIIRINMQPTASTADFAGDGTSGIYVFGAQYETGSVATSYIPTTTGSVTRNADVVAVSGAVSGSIGQTEGTIYAEVETRVTAGTAAKRILTISNGNDADNRISIGKQADDAFIGSILSGGVAQAVITSTTNQSGSFKIAFAFKANDAVLYINGTQIGTDTSLGIPSGLNRVDFGQSAANAAQFNDRIRAAALYTTRLTNAELAALTTP